MEFNSPNFAFRADLDPPLMHQVVLAEHYCRDDPCTALTKLRLFGELLAKIIAARYGVYTDERSRQHEILRELKYRGYNLEKMNHGFKCRAKTDRHPGAKRSYAFKRCGGFR